MSTSTNSSASPSLGRLPSFAAFVLALPLVPAAYAADGSAISTYVGGAFNWSSTANWTSGIVPDGTGAVATFSNNYTSGVQVNLGLGGGSTSITLGTINYTDTTPSSQITLHGGTAGTANLTFDDVDGISEINVATNAGVPLQFGNAGTLNILGDDNLRISVTGTLNPVRFNTTSTGAARPAKSPSRRAVSRRKTPTSCPAPPNSRSATACKCAPCSTRPRSLATNPSRP